MDYRPMYCRMRIEATGEQIVIPIFGNPLFPTELFMNCPCSPDVFLALYCRK